MSIELPSQPNQAHKVMLDTVEAARQAEHGVPDQPDLAPVPTLEFIGGDILEPRVTVGNHKLLDKKGRPTGKTETSFTATDTARLDDGSFVSSTARLRHKTGQPSEITDTEVDVSRMRGQGDESSTDRYRFQDPELARAMIADVAEQIASKR